MKKLIGIFAIALSLFPSFVLGAHSSGKIARVGLLRVDSPPRKPVDEFRQALRELGYIEGQNLKLEIRWAESKLDRLPELAAELVRLDVDVIVTQGPQGIGAAKAATSTIPIVMGRIDDVDVHGFVKTLARPGGNITGLSFQTGELTGKCLELLTEILPKVSNVAALWDATGNAKQLKAVEAAGTALNVKIQIAKVRGADDLDRALSSVAAAREQAVLILGSPFLTFNVARLATLTARHRLPAIYTNTNFADAGGLMAYGPNESDPNWGWKRAAVFVDKILKGAKPADLPVEQPTRFELVINLKTAKQIGLTIPPNVLARADRVIR
ncbi:MAG TPA: ABC transporter substrate-binding protein [Candidatus Udaeobacter sp.]|nr:ABC transporter substrate-binding protein [Candidatus Udaeobacter sp.]